MLLKNLYKVLFYPKPKYVSQEQAKNEFIKFVEWQKKQEFLPRSPEDVVEKYISESDIAIVDVKIMYHISKRNPKKDFWFGILVLVFGIALGVLITYLTSPHLPK